MVGSWFGNRETPPWAKCKESLFEQVVFKNCTPTSFISPDSIQNDNSNSEIIDEQQLPYEQPQN
jgi:hypothetical protein